jgi:hypothetical protein
MSGRLIILPKKTYCPWNSKNVERVLQDERLHAKEQAKQQQDSQADQSKARLRALKKKNNQYEGSSTDSHVNLFAPEEEKALQQLQVATNDKKKSQGMMMMIQPLCNLGQSTKKADKAFDLQQQKRQPSDPSKVVHKKSRDDRLKSRMDPMHRFHSSGECHSNAAPLNEEQLSSSPADPVMDLSTTSKESKHNKKRKQRREDISDSSSESSSNESSDDDRKKHRKRRRRQRKEHKDGKRSRKSKESSQKDDSMEELRRRRMEREEKEQRRQQSIVDDAKYRSSASHKYSNQYNPTLSRR